MRELCKYASDLIPGQDSSGRLRNCALGVDGGVVTRIGTCRTCDRHTTRGPNDTAVPVTTTLEVVPCDYAAELSGTERENRGLSHAKAWKLCSNKTLPLGKEAVCPCEGCGPSCRGYRHD